MKFSIRKYLFFISLFSWLVFSSLVFALDQATELAPPQTKQIAQPKELQKQQSRPPQKARNRPKKAHHSKKTRKHKQPRHKHIKSQPHKKPPKPKLKRHKQAHRHKLAHHKKKTQKHKHAHKHTRAHPKNAKKPRPTKQKIATQAKKVHQSKPRHKKISPSKQTQVHRTHFVYAKNKPIKPFNPNHFEAIIAMGASKLKAGSSQLVVTSQETDTLYQTNANVWNTFTGQVGFGYLHYLFNPRLYPTEVKWFQAIEPEVNLYYLSSHSIKGNINRYNNPNFSDFNFDIPVQNVHLMFDLDINVISYKKISAYAKGGIGQSWTKLGYSDSSTSPCSVQHVSLYTNTTSDSAWEAGGGLLYHYNDQLSLSLEYLYTHLGRVKLASSGGAGTISAPILATNQFHLNTQSALLGLHLAL
ncbi:MAG TPA: outer membrane beta-barrel protein [Gammaproteobacteria bacterium]|nr:outer membrane beta-barrel protein [Gammaproteobacteria bacterium]